MNKILCSLTVAALGLLGAGTASAHGPAWSLTLGPGGVAGVSVGVPAPVYAPVHVMTPVAYAPPVYAPPMYAPPVYAPRVYHAPIAYAPPVVVHAPAYGYRHHGHYGYGYGHGYRHHGHWRHH